MRWESSTGGEWGGWWILTGIIGRLGERCEASGWIVELGGGFGSRLGRSGGKRGLGGLPRRAEVAVLNFSCQAAAEVDGGNFDKAVSEHGQGNGQRPEQQHDGWPWRVGEDPEANVEHNAVE